MLDAVTEELLALARDDAGTFEDERLKAFIGWLASLLVEIPVTVEIVEHLDFGDGSGHAGWIQGGHLLLSERYRALWEDPLSESFLGLLCHETAHERFPHHGPEMRAEVERLAGKLAWLCLNRGAYMLERWEATRRDVDREPGWIPTEGEELAIAAASFEWTAAALAGTEET